MPVITPIQQQRLRHAKAAYATHLVSKEKMQTLIAGDDVTPRAGDLVLARVDRLGQHKRIELVDGRRAALFDGDEIVVCYGNRYAPDQFEAYVPATLQPCELAAAGGVAARVTAAHASLKRPTAITPLGLLGDRAGQPINIAQYALKRRLRPADAPIIAVVGTAMNAGKTTAAAHLVSGLSVSGFKVGAAKITGTGAGGDVWYMTDAGAHKVLDFTHAGHASTYLAGDQAVQDIFVTLTAELADADVDAIVIEIADGLYQAETASLLRSPLFRRQVQAVLFAAPDALGAKSGVAWLREASLPVLAVTGLLTASPLAVRETATAVALPVLGLKDLRSPKQLNELFDGILKPAGEPTALRVPRFAKAAEEMAGLRVAH